MNRRGVFSWMMVFGLMATLVVTATTAEATGRRGLASGSLLALEVPVDVEPEVEAMVNNASAQESGEDEPERLPNWYAYALVFVGGQPVYVIATHEEQQRAIDCIKSCYPNANPLTFPTYSPVVNCSDCGQVADGDRQDVYKIEVRLTDGNKKKTFNFSAQYNGTTLGMFTAVAELVEIKKLEWAQSLGLEPERVEVSELKFKLKSE